MEHKREPRNRSTPIYLTDFWQKYKSNSMEEEECSQQMMLEQLDVHKQKNELWPKSDSL